MYIYVCIYIHTYVCIYMFHQDHQMFYILQNIYATHTVLDSISPLIIWQKLMLSKLYFTEKKQQDLWEWDKTRVILKYRICFVLEWVRKRWDFMGHGRVRVWAQTLSMRGKGYACSILLMDTELCHCPWLYRFPSLTWSSGLQSCWGLLAPEIAQASLSRGNWEGTKTQNSNLLPLLRYF